MKNLFLFIALLMPAGYYAQSGSLDGDFDADGWVSLNPFNTWSDGIDIALPSDTRILIGGSGDNPGNFSDFVVYALYPDGSPDPNFGDKGLSAIDVNNAQNLCRAMALQNDGHIVLGGNMDSMPDESGFLLIRTDADGQVDEDFGIAGSVLINFGEDRAYLNDICLQEDGKIVCVGSIFYNMSSSSDIIVLRLMPDGSLDHSFSFDGKVVSDINLYDDGIVVGMSSDGKIMVAGAAYSGSSRTPLLIRYNDDGTLDSTFGKGGFVTPERDGVDQWFSAMAFTNDGKILATGGSNNILMNDILLARFNPDGSPDLSFSFNGWLNTDINDGYDNASDLLIQPDSMILVGGSHHSELALVRYHPNGTLDSSFGMNGKIISQNRAPGSSLSKIAMQADGKILTVGNFEGHISVARFLSGLDLGIGEVDAYLGSLLIYPNPITHQEIKVNYQLSQSQKVGIVLLDMTGREVAVLQSSRMENTGEQNKVFTLPNLPSGQYLLQLQTYKGQVGVQLQIMN